MTFAMDIYGKMSKESRDFLSSLTTKIKARADPASQSTITVAATISGISKALAFGNGTCLLYSHQLRLLGVNLGAEPVRITAPPPPPPEPLDPTEVAADESEFFAPPGLEGPPEIPAFTANPSCQAFSSQAPLAQLAVLAPQAQYTAPNPSPPRVPVQWVTELR